MINDNLEYLDEKKFETILFLPDKEERKGEGGLRTKGYFKKSYEDKPLISIITVVFNGEKYLEQTIQSVINQTYDNVEYIIIDGGSTDGTLDIIKKYEDQIDYWVSEPDKGIYDAMNKGISLAVGEWLNFMNTGDLFIDDKTIDEVIKGFLSKNQKKIILSGFVKIVDENYEWLGYRHPYQKLSECNMLSSNCIAHQAAFISISVFKSVGYFSTLYKIQGDYDYWLKCKKLNIKFEHIKKDIAYFLNDGISSSDANIIKSIREKNLSLHHNGFISHGRYLYKTGKEICIFQCKKLIKKIIGKKFAKSISVFNLKKIKLNYEK